MSDKIPVIIIHNGFQDYLRYTIIQANKQNKVYLLGNTNVDLKLDNFETVNFSGLSDGFEELKKNYVHLNTTPFEYELFCYQRWYIIRNFMSAKKLDVVFYIDSDVLLYADVDKEWCKYDKYTMTLLHRSAATSSFITYKGICDFCKLLTYAYSNKNSYVFKKIESHFRVRQECRLAGGVCDMTLLEHFHREDDLGGGPGRVGEMMQIIDDSTYDHNINTADNDFSYKNGAKEIKIVDKQPYVFNIKLNKDIKFNALHFQGQAKSRMGDIYARTS